MMSGPGAREQAGSQSPRRFARYPADIRIEVQVFRTTGAVSYWGRSNELGEDGVGATMTGEIEPGEVVSMELTVPTTSLPMKFRALVRYRMGLRHGFEFLALSAEQRTALQELCKTLSTGL